MKGVGKSLKAFGAVEKTGIKANRTVGKAFERSAIKKLNLNPETAQTRLKQVGNMKSYRVADALDKEGNVVEMKHVKRLRMTDQTRDQFEWARVSNKKVYFACDEGYTQNIDEFSDLLNQEYGGLFGGILGV